MLIHHHSCMVPLNGTIGSMVSIDGRHDVSFNFFDVCEELAMIGRSLNYAGELTRDNLISVTCLLTLKVSVYNFPSVIFYRLGALIIIPFVQTFPAKHILRIGLVRQKFEMSQRARK